MRRAKFAMRGFEEAMERDRQERLAKARKVHAVWLNVCMEHGLERGAAPAAKADTSRRSDTVDRKVSSEMWAVREWHRDGRFQWHQVKTGSEADARALAERLRKQIPTGEIEALRMGRPPSGRSIR